jgi:hypothetical protein
MILIIAESLKAAYSLKKLLIKGLIKKAALKSKAGKAAGNGLLGGISQQNKILIFIENGRVITPASEKERLRLEYEGKKGQYLAGKASEVYLIRRNGVKLIKKEGENVYE